MAKGMFSGLLERKPLDEVAPVAKDVLRPSLEDDYKLEENYKLKDGIWKRNLLQLEKLKQKFEKEKAQLSRSARNQMEEEIGELEFQANISHTAMSEALWLLEKQQEINVQTFEVQRLEKELADSQRAVTAKHEELQAALALQNELPDRIRRLDYERTQLLYANGTKVTELDAAKRRTKPETQETIRREENVHS